MKEGESLDIGGYLISRKDNRIYTDRTRVFSEHRGWRRTAASPQIGEGNLLEIYVDKNLIEVFINRGEYVISSIVYDLGDKITANIDGEIWFCSGLMDSVMTIRQGKAVPAMVMQGKNVVQKADIDKEALSANSSPTDQTRQMMNLFMRLNKEQKQYGFSNFFMHGKDIWFQCFGGSILIICF